MKPAGELSSQRHPALAPPPFPDALNAIKTPVVPPGGKVGSAPMTTIAEKWAPRPPITGGLITAPNTVLALKRKCCVFTA
jgi:hypothetical protein